MNLIKTLSVILTAICILTQSLSAQNETIKIDCKLEVNQTEWIYGSNIIAKLSLKNNSDKQIEIQLPPYFTLDPPVENKQGSYEYGSHEKEKDHIITKKEGNLTFFKIQQFFKFNLDKNEQKIAEFYLSRLAWQKKISSVIIDRDWFEMPGGYFNLYYSYSYYLDKENVLKRKIEINSNKISVKLNSLK